MAEVRLVDVSLRDGNQSLWGATGLTTKHIVQGGALLDRVGFRALDYTSSTHMGVAVRMHLEDPWERIQPHPRAVAAYAVAVHRHRIPVYLLGGGAPRPHAARL